MVVAFPFAVSFVPRGRWFRAGWIFAIVVVLSGIVLAESATGIIAACVITALAVVLGWRDHLLAAGRAPSRRYWATLAGSVLTLGVLGAIWYEALHRDIHRDLSFTGRSHIWKAAWDTSTTQTRIIGDGFGTVWMHPWRVASPNGPFEEITTQLGYYVPHGHNSVMGLLPEVGLVGVALFALLYAVPVVSSVARGRSSSDASVRETSRTIVLGVVALVLAGVTEPLSTVPLGFYVAVLLIARDPLETAPEPVPAPGPATEAPAATAPGRRRGPRGRAL
jgi:O-antigen ligase